MRATVDDATPYHDDGHHLSPAGSYLEALVLYRSLTGQTPVGAVRKISGPAVELSGGRVFADSIVALVDVPETIAVALQRLAASARIAVGDKRTLPMSPAPLSAECPPLQSHGDPVDAGALAGRWVGVSSVLATPTREPVDVELMIHGAQKAASVRDSIVLRVPGIMFAGTVSLHSDGTVAVLSGSVTPLSRRGRTGPPEPFAIELRAVRRDATLAGRAMMHQLGQGKLASFTAIGELTLTRR